MSRTQDLYTRDKAQAMAGLLRREAVIVSVDTRVGVLGYPNRCPWLRAHFEPVDTIAYPYLV